MSLENICNSLKKSNEEIHLAKLERLGLKQNPQLLFKIIDILAKEDITFEPRIIHSNYNHVKEWYKDFTSKKDVDNDTATITKRNLATFVYYAKKEGVSPKEVIQDLYLNN